MEPRSGERAWPSPGPSAIETIVPRAGCVRHPAVRLATLTRWSFEYLVSLAAVSKWRVSTALADQSSRARARGPRERGRRRLASASAPPETAQAAEPASRRRLEGAAISSTDVSDPSKET